MLSTIRSWFVGNLDKEYIELLKNFKDLKGSMEQAVAKADKAQGLNTILMNKNTKLYEEITYLKSQLAAAHKPKSKKKNEA